VTAQASAVVSDAPAAASRTHGVVTGGARRRRVAADTVTHVFLGLLAVFWLIPIVWILMESFNKNTLPFTTTFFPTHYTLDNYVKLFTDTSVMNFPQMFLRTLVIAIFVCAIQLVFVLSVGFVMSRLRFRTRRPFMNTALVLGMFPGIMAVVAIYFILKAMGLTGSSTATTVGLILVYSAGSGAGFYVMKGFMDTIPVSMDEAAVLDGCTRWQVFTRIILPITKPMMVYQAIVGFLTPWLDFVLAKAIARTQGNYTVSLGLWQMLQKEYISEWYTRFAAGAVLVSIPIAVLFIIMQRFYQSSMTGSVKG
jgi:arabinogalactan oligomer/maltooligosaccharide transport system permease protein